MKIGLRKVLPAFLLLASTHIFAQQISGTWEGVMPGSGGTFLQVNVTQRGYELCGFTYDYVMYDKRSFCKAKFEGRYDYKKNFGLMIGTGFIRNSGSHVLMKIKLWRQEGDSKDMLRASWLQDDVITSFLSGADDGAFTLKRVSSSPEKLPAGVPPCFPKTPLPPATVKPKPVVPSKPATTPTVKPKAKSPVAKAPVPKKSAPVPQVKLPVTKQPQTVNVPKIIQPVVVQQPTGAIIKQMNTRRRSEQSRLVINTPHLNLKLYDNGTVDNDSVSIFYNGRLLLSHQRLSEKAIELNIDLDESKEIHEITMYAENLGSIPPNTALVVVTAGGKRYELRSKASMEENAVLIFEYKKDAVEK